MKTQPQNLKEIGKNIVSMMLEIYDTDISVFSGSLLEDTLKNRIDATVQGEAELYPAYLAVHSTEAIALKSAFHNSYSVFYRDPHTFSFLHQYVLPRILVCKVKTNDPEIRIWSAGCAAGQEAYSLAMIADDVLKNSGGKVKFRVFATDRLPFELEIAHRAEYNSEQLQNLPYRYIQDYFTHNAGVYSIGKNLKKNVEFSEYDLLDKNSTAPPVSIFGDFDLVMCSNVLLYYSARVQKMMLEKFERTISDGGFLATSESETGIVNTSAGFRHYMSPAAVFVKR